MLELPQNTTEKALERLSTSYIGSANDTSYIGSLRACTPAETLERIRPYLARVGITRVADLTYLDNLGLPVVQAIRPNSRNLSVSQGKGITKALATVSALMEAIELWHAEQPALSAITVEIGEMTGQLPYSVYDLNVSRYHLLHDALPLEWFPATTISTGTQTFVPADYIRIDSTMQHRWVLPTFLTTSNGLASGNVQEEAIIHGLYEVIERDTLVRFHSGSLQSLLIRAETVDGVVTAPLIEQFKKADATIKIHGLLGPTGIACFEVHLSSPSYPRIIKGYGCHLNSDIALYRALTEAAQIRLSIIAGSRDDISASAYIEIQRMQQPVASTSREGTHFHDIPSSDLLNRQDELDEILTRLSRVVYNPPVFVDLTHPEINIPVVFVVVPQFHMMEE